MTFRPGPDRFVIRRADPEQMSAIGIFVPDTAQEQPMKGAVVAIGAGACSEDGASHPLEVEVGDQLLSRQMVPGRDQARRRRTDRH